MAVITRLYDNYESARQALDSVKRLRLQDVETSILANEEVGEYHRSYEERLQDSSQNVEVRDESSGAAIGAGTGAVVGGGAGLLAGLGMLAIPGLGPLVAAGWLAATAAGAIGGGLAGGAIGALADLGVSEEDVPVYAEAFRRGGVMVSVRTPEEHRAEVESALSTVGYSKVSDLRHTYEGEGWRSEETEAEREDRLRNQSPHVPPIV